jgi:DNA adenine methylase
MDLAINSPFRYAGGKFYARKLILEQIPEHDCYIEPFAGGGSIFFAKSKVSQNWLNDLDRNLINTYLVIRDCPEELTAFLKGEQASKERHHFYKNDFAPQNSLEEAARWFYLNRTSYSGIMKPQNCFWGYGDKYSMRPENWPRNIQRTSSKLQGVRLTSFDFEQVIADAPDNAFLFVDPPYFNADQDKFYTCSFTAEDHFRLSSILRLHQERLKFLITYDNSPEVRELYEWATEIQDKEWNYTINRTDDQKNGQKKDDNYRGDRYKGREIFILNYHPTKPSELTTQMTFAF